MSIKYRLTTRFVNNRKYKKIRNNKKRKRKRHKNMIDIGKYIHKLTRVSPSVELELMKTNMPYSVHKRISLPKSFSLTKNPDESLEILHKITNMFFSNCNISIFIDCGKTTEMDIAALSILNIIIKKGAEYITNLGYKFFVEGNFPNDNTAKEIFLYSGLPKVLNLIKKQVESIETIDLFETEKDCNKETNRIIEYYNNCLRKNGYQLNDSGRVYFSSLISEIVDNARIHTGNGSYYSAGFYSNNIRKGQLCIINFGNSMYESLNSETTSEIIKKQINDYVNHQRNYFDISYNEENAWTVFALQYKISRFRNVDSPDRGTGMIKFIEAFFDMGQNIKKDKLNMSITSGNCHILFDGTYTLKNSIIKNEEVQIISFNKENSLKKKPDNRYVKKLKQKFPGVIINVEFFVDKEYLDKIKEE